MDNKKIKLHPECDYHDVAMLGASSASSWGYGPYRYAADQISTTLCMPDGSTVTTRMRHAPNSPGNDARRTAAWRLGAVSAIIDPDHTHSCYGVPRGIEWEIDGVRYASRCEDADQLACWLAVAGLYEATIGGESPLVWTVEWEAGGICGRLYCQSRYEADGLTGWISHRLVVGARTSVLRVPLAEIAQKKSK